jgi:D-alanyl-D-alanine carboxypeptidase
LYVDGLKTGTTPAAGQVFVGTAQAPGKHRIITVVMHSPNRFAETSKMILNVYDRYALN